MWFLRSPSPYMSLGGFMLIETLIALALLAAISLTSLSALGLANRVWSSVDQREQSLESLRLTQELISGWLRQASPVPLQLNDQLIPPLTGDQASIELIAPLSAYAGHPGLFLIRLEGLPAQSVDPEQAGRLIAHFWLLHPEVMHAPGPGLTGKDGFDDQGPEWIRSADGDAVPTMPALQGKQRLLTGLDDFQLRYFGINKQSLEPAWHDQWMERMDMPQAVEFRLLTRGLPETSVLIRLTQDLSLSRPLSQSRDASLLRHGNLSDDAKLSGEGLAKGALAR